MLDNKNFGEDDLDPLPPEEKKNDVYKSKSLPHLIRIRDSGVGCSTGSYSGVEQEEHDIDIGSIKIGNYQKVYDLRQFLTLRQHYYPEGGWGWVIVFCAFLVQCLTHGIHGASGIIMQQVIRRFNHVTHHEAGT
ncbi:hypothetical protein Phum_PHUM517810 [Pediculus humanus corporis]|uniref:Monocarboxylate transporter n=1 Tax=Pediculus humanus subsp. corporis TaxID=121224 RepID=E0VYS2_PEDHC|nr:uncharacterized protein Phum_PHUM517810 [Pediculus humanus corporis]EEB18528.1 hypothetical protein Phum_PHUM517810 [Pediculus humanus corporis]